MKQYYVNAQGLITHRFACSGRKVRIGRAITLSEAEALELRALRTVRSVEPVPVEQLPEGLASAPAPAREAAAVVAELTPDEPSPAPGESEADLSGGEPPKRRRKAP